MGRADYYSSGDWNFICDLCGRKAKSSDATRTWDNQYVCRSHREVRNPQDFQRAARDKQSVPWTRPPAVKSAPRPVGMFDLLGISDTFLLRKSNVQLALEDTVSVTDTLQLGPVFNLALSDGVTIGDALTLRDFGLEFADSVSASDALVLTRQRITNRTLNGWRLDEIQLG